MLAIGSGKLNIIVKWQKKFGWKKTYEEGLPFNILTAASK